MADDSDDFAVLLHRVKVGFYRRLACLVLPSCRSLRESLLLGAVPLLWGRCLNSSATVRGVSRLWEAHTINAAAFLINRVSLTPENGFSHSSIKTNSPVLVEATFAVIADVLGENSLQRTQTPWCIYISNHTHYNNRWGLKNCACFNHFSLVGFF